jgi:four helix bundle protein
MMMRFSVLDKAHRLTLAVYRLTSAYPAEEKFGIVSQMRRSAVSVDANLIEGNCRDSARDKRKFAVIADGSLQELKYYLLLSRDLRYVDEDQFVELNRHAEEVGRMLHGLRKYLKSDV